MSMIGGMNVPLGVITLCLLTVVSCNDDVTENDRRGRFLQVVKTGVYVDPTCLSCITATDLQTCTNDADCTNNGAFTGLYCRDFGGTAGQRCVPRKQAGASCTTDTECVSGSCPSFCVSNYLLTFCYTQCA